MSVRFSPEWRAKVSAGLRGRQLTMEHRANISTGVRANPALGRYVRTSLTKQRSSRAHQQAAFQKQPAPVQRPTLLDIAWAAGIYEGEGTCSVGGGGKSFSVAVTQKDPELLRRLCRLFGGYILRPTPDGCSRWLLSGIRGAGFAFTIFGFLTARRRLQVKIALRAASY